MKTLIHLCIIGVIALLVSCVSQNVHKDLKEKKQKCETERDRLKGINDSLSTKVNEMQAEYEKLKKQINPLIDDTTIRGRAYRTLTTQYNQVEAQYELLYKNFERLRKEHDDQEKKISNKLFNTQDDLLKKEDELKKLEASLNDQKNKLETLKRDLDNKDIDLKTKDFELKKQSNLIEEKNRKLQELTAILNKKDSITKALKDKVSNALTGFINDGLTVEMKNGKIYVSLDEKLLFKSAKWEVDARGKDALKKLAQLLSQNTDINVMIEGHTDDVPYSSKVNTGIEDNWDLSVKRATAIVKILLNSGVSIDPKRIIPAGRSEFVPVDFGKTSEARQKSRRIEVILTPKLDELFKVLETN